MDRDEHRRPELTRQDAASVGGHADIARQQGLHRGRAQRHDDLRTHDVELRTQPMLAGAHMRQVRLAMDPLLTARLEAADDRLDVERRTSEETATPPEPD